MAYVILGAADDRDRANQFVRLMGLSKPIGELSSDTLVTAYNPETGSNWDVAGIKNDPEWKAKGNPDENGQTNGYSFEKLRDGEPLGEDNFILTDVPGANYEEVAKWLRSKLPLNTDRGSDGWSLRAGVQYTLNKDGTLPDSDPDENGNFPIYNANWWLRFDLDQAQAWFPTWYSIYINADPDQSYVENQFATNTKVGRTGTSTPIYEYPTGAPVLALVDPAYVEAGSVQWVRLQR